MIQLILILKEFYILLYYQLIYIHEIMDNFYHSIYFYNKYLNSDYVPFNFFPPHKIYFYDSCMC